MANVNKSQHWEVAANVSTDITMSQHSITMYTWKVLRLEGLWKKFISLRKSQHISVVFSVHC